MGSWRGLLWLVCLGFRWAVKVGRMMEVVEVMVDPEGEVVDLEEVDLGELVDQVVVGLEEGMR